MSHTKDGFRWDENEEPFLELLEEHLEAPSCRCSGSARIIARLPLRRIAVRQRPRLSIGQRRHRGEISAVVPVVADSPLVETPEDPLAVRRCWRGVNSGSTLRANAGWFESNSPTMPRRATGYPSAIPARRRTVPIQSRSASLWPTLLWSHSHRTTDEIEALLRVGAALAFSKACAPRRSQVCRHCSEELEQNSAGGTFAAVTPETQPRHLATCQSGARAWGEVDAVQREPTTGVAERSGIDEAAQAGLIRPQPRSFSSGDPKKGPAWLRYRTCRRICPERQDPLLHHSARPCSGQWLSAGDRNRRNKTNLLTQSHQRS